jgi:flagellar biosynthesis/type III secretory pathway chaperone
MSTPRRIKNILSEQILGYRTLLAVLQKERECLINLNHEAVEALSKEKDTIVLKLRLLEEERIRLVRAFSKGAGATGELTLQGLYDKTGDAAFADMRLQMISLLQGIAELNEFNRILIDRSSHFVRRTLGFLESFGSTVKRNKTGTMLSREV